MNELTQNLLELQSIEFDALVEANTENRIEELRGKIPAQILGHYDRMVARGKKGVAAIRNQVCTGCHMQVPRGAVLTLMHGDDIQICESCGRYLYLPDESEKQEPVKKTPRIPRKRNDLLHAA